MRILHVSADYPDPLSDEKPRAISNLVALADAHTHRVVSINRVGWHGAPQALGFADAAGDAHRAVTYAAPPKGVGFRGALERLAAWIAEDCDDAGFRPDLVHAHKLTVEGTVGAWLARTWRVPLVISVQGKSDLALLAARPDLAAHFRGIWVGAAAVFCFAVWTRAHLEGRFGPRRGTTWLLPCPSPADTVLLPAEAPEPVVRTAFHMRDARRKNAAGLIGAVARAARQVPSLRLEIAGGGDAVAFARLAALAHARAPGRVRFLGPVPQPEVQPLFNSAAAVALVSHRESFGMAAAEALLAGAPCLISRGQGLDGYFEDGSVVVAVDADSEVAIAAGLVRLVREQSAFKARLAALAAAGGLAVLQRPAIREAYLTGLVAAFAE